jgi:uncharacterized membrane protein
MGRYREIDLTRGLFILSVSWVHTAFFLSAFSPSEIFYYTETFKKMTAFNYIAWTISEQITPAGFFILMGISIELSLPKESDLSTRIKFLYMRGLVISLIGYLTVMPLYLIGPLEAVDDIGKNGITPLFMMGIFVDLGLVLIFSALLRKTLNNISEHSRSKIFLLTGISLLIFSGLVEAFDSKLYLYVESLPTPLQCVVEGLLVAGKTGAFKSTFSFLPWLGYTLLGLYYGARIASLHPKDYRKEIGIAFVLILMFLAVRHYHINSPEFFKNLFFIPKYPPSMPLSMISIAYFIIIINVFRVIVRFKKEYFLVSLLEKAGKNSLFIYLGHFYLFAVIGLIIHKCTGHYVENSLLLHAIWMGGMLLLVYISHTSWLTIKHKWPWLRYC